MSQPRYLFPHRMTRRDLLKVAGAAVGGAAVANAGLTFAADAEPVKMGAGKFTYTLDPNWGALPAGMNYGHGCAIVVDKSDRIMVTSRSENPAVAIFDKKGELLATWSKEFVEKVGMKPGQVAATAHGLFWNKEADGEYLYWTENVSGGGANRIGARIYKTDMEGKILYTLGNVEKEDSTSQKFNVTNPTDVAVAANGDIYIVDGYGSQIVARFDKNFKHIKTIGGRGGDHGKFNTCHGVWINTLRDEPEVYIADRANNRVEVYSLELEYKRTISDVRTPCCFYQHDGHLFVPELGSRVSVLDAKDAWVARLGDGAGVKQDVPGKFRAPHALTLDSDGNLYVVEWVGGGRVRKYAHTPEA